MQLEYVTRSDEDLWKHVSGKTDLDHIATWIEDSVRRMFSTIIFTNGCFDILHLGHLQCFYTMKNKYPKKSYLIVGLNDDDSVKKLKGGYRPIHTQEQRAVTLMSTAYVNAVFIFHSDTPEELIEVINPDVLFKGGDYKNKEISGAKFVEKNSGKIFIIDTYHNYSTTNEIQKIGQIYMKEQFGENCLILQTGDTNGKSN